MENWQNWEENWKKCVKGNVNVSFTVNPFYEWLPSTSFNDLL